MSSSSGDSDLDAPITQQVAQKQKTKHAGAPDVQGDHPHWAYTPPEGATLLDHTVDADVFDWDTVHDDADTEMWLIRVPDAIQPKHLHGLAIDPSSPATHTPRIGQLVRKHATYDVWSVAADDAPDHPGADALRGLACLLPRKRDGTLSIAPRRVARWVDIAARPPRAAVVDPPVVYQDPPRPSYPKDRLRHAFVPYGARATETLEDVSMDDVEAVADGDETVVTAPPSKAKSEKHKERKGKKRGVDAVGEEPSKVKSEKSREGKKRKGDTESSKKSKKHKSQV